MSDPHSAFQPDGFTFGPAHVYASASMIVDKRRGRSVIIGLDTIAGRSLTIYVSPNGRSVRVFMGHEELT